LPLWPRGAAGEVNAQQRQLARRCVKAQLLLAALGVELAAVNDLDDLAGFMAGINPHA
jgi:hypothetical protein